MDFLCPSRIHVPHPNPFSCAPCPHPHRAAIPQHRSSSTGRTARRVSPACPPRLPPGMLSRSTTSSTTSTSSEYLARSPSRASAPPSTNMVVCQDCVCDGVPDEHRRRKIAARARHSPTRTRTRGEECGQRRRVHARCIRCADVRARGRRTPRRGQCGAPVRTRRGRCGVWMPRRSVRRVRTHSAR